jgi:hypothetical protein
MLIMRDMRNFYGVVAMKTRMILMSSLGVTDMAYEHIARKISAEIPFSAHVNDNPVLEVLEDRQMKPISELEEQGFELVAVLPNRTGGLSTGIFKRYIQEDTIDL